MSHCSSGRRCGGNITEEAEEEMDTLAAAVIEDVSGEPETVKKTMEYREWQLAPF